MRCRFCGSDRNLVTERWKDEDGFWSDDLIDLCEYCVEHSEDRRKARQEWEYYHDEPCPEGELPQPGPHPTKRPIGKEGRCQQPNQQQH